MREIPLKGLGWRCDVKDSTAKKIDIGYLLKEGPQEHVIFGVLLEGNMKTRIELMISWGLNRFRKPESYKILGKTIEPKYEVCYMNKSIVGEIYGTPEGSIRIDQLIHHPTKSERGEMRFFSPNELPDEIEETAKLIDEEVWQRMRKDVITRFAVPEKMIPPSLLKHVFLAYRAGNSQGEASARKLGEYLKNKDIPVWFFPRRVGWGDSITTEEEEGIKNSFAGVIVFTADFLEGRTAIEEYRALLAKKRGQPGFKAGLLLVGCTREKIPPFMEDYFWVRVDGPEDPRFGEEARKIHRGLLGLPLESQKKNLNGQ